MSLLDRITGREGGAKTGAAAAASVPRDDGPPSNPM